jgi:hypothetical protein
MLRPSFPASALQALEIHQYVVVTQANYRDMLDLLLPILESGKTCLVSISNSETVYMLVMHLRRMVDPTLVGYATGKYQDYSPENKVIFTSDGYAMMTRLFRQSFPVDVSLFDAPRWTVAQEVLEASIYADRLSGSRTKILMLTSEHEAKKTRMASLS